MLWSYPMPLPNSLPPDSPPYLSTTPLDSHRWVKPMALSQVLGHLHRGLSLPSRNMDSEWFLVGLLPCTLSNLSSSYSPPWQLMPRPRGSSVTLSMPLQPWPLLSSRPLFQLSARKLCLCPESTLHPLVWNQPPRISVIMAGIPWWSSG